MKFTITIKTTSMHRATLIRDEVANFCASVGEALEMPVPIALIISDVQPDPPVSLLEVLELAERELVQFASPKSALSTIREAIAREKGKLVP